MPYIDQLRREQLKNYECDGDTPKTPGELNYILTQTVNQYLKENYHYIGYTQYNEAIGVLECVKQEFYRRAVVPYEDVKIKENGDVY